VRAPEAARAHAAMVERLIESERPAHVRCELAFVSPEVAPEESTPTDTEEPP
jgi:hypothetical protein